MSRCYICDEQIPDKEIKVNIRDGKVEPCRKCMKEIHSIVYDDTIVQDLEDDEGILIEIGDEELGSSEVFIDAIDDTEYGDF